MTSKFDYCASVFAKVKTEGGKWPYPGALGDCARRFNELTVDQCAAWILEKAQRGTKKTAEKLRAR